MPLKVLYPPRLLLMTGYVQVVALILNSPLYNFNELLVLLCWIPLLMMPYLLTKKRWVYALCVSLFFIVELPNFVHWLVMKSPLAVYSLLTIANTNNSEATDFINLMFNWRWLLLVPYLCLFVYTVCKPPVTSNYKHKYLYICMLIVFPVIFLTDGICNHRFVRKSIPQTIKAFVFSVEEIKANKKSVYRTIKQVDVITNLDKNNHHIAVLVIGESANRNYYHLFGYERETTPKLSSRNDIICFDNTVSAYTNTLQSVLSIVSNFGLSSNNIKAKTATTLIDVFHSAGYKTYWLSNQSPIGIWDNRIAGIGKLSDYYTFCNIAAASSFESNLVNSYDEILFAPFLNALNDTSCTNKFIVLHLMGSHSDYNKRYPNQFKVFNYGKTKKEHLTNSYENTILYNDFIVDSLFNMVSSYCKRNPNNIATVVYVSDHGENVKDALGHTYAGSMPTDIVEVPFILWLSDEYKTQNDSLVEIMKQRKHDPFVLDDMFDTFIHLNGMSTSYSSDVSAFFSKSFHVNRKRVLEDKEDYDLKKGY